MFKIILIIGQSLQFSTFIYSDDECFIHICDGFPSIKIDWIMHGICGELMFDVTIEKLVGDFDDGPFFQCVSRR